MCSEFTPDFGYDNSTIILIGDVYCPNTKCLGKLCHHKKTFQSLGRSDYQCPQCASVCQVRNIPFEDQTNSFLLSLVQGVQIFEENPKSIRNVIGDVYCPGEYCINREKGKSFGGYVNARRSCYGCDNCGAWLFVHKIPSTLQEHVKTTKTDKTRFFFAKKMLPDKQLFISVPFQSTKYRKKELCVDNIKTIGDVYCPTCRIEKSVYLSTNKTTSFFDCKKCKAACNVWIFLLRIKKQQLCCLAVTVHIVLQERPSPLRKREAISILKKFLRQSQPSTPEPEPKKVKMSPKME